jgi:hypothetical protein
MKRAMTQEKGAVSQPPATVHSIETVLFSYKVVYRFSYSTNNSSSKLIILLLIINPAGGALTILAYYSFYFFNRSLDARMHA